MEGQVPYHLASGPSGSSRFPGKAGQSGPEPALSIRRVLIVEDEVFIQLDLEEELVAAGFIVVGAVDTAEAAVVTAGAERPDIVVMDIGLRGARDGVDAALEIWQRFAIRSVFVSGNIDDAFRQRAAAAEPFGFIRKPYLASEVVALLAAKD
jgi:DNA-binding NarL/FixJ family response regulator